MVDAALGSRVSALNNARIAVQMDPNQPAFAGAVQPAAVAWAGVPAVRLHAGLPGRPVQQSLPDVPGGQRGVQLLLPRILLISTGERKRWD